MEQWKREQEKEIELLVDSYVKSRKTDPHPPRWMRWAKNYICQRFRHVERSSWIELLLIMDDDSDFMTRRGDLARQYLIQIRDYARRYVNCK